MVNKPGYGTVDNCIYSTQNKTFVGNKVYERDYQIKLNK